MYTRVIQLANNHVSNIYTDNKDVDTSYIHSFLVQFTTIHNLPINSLVGNKLLLTHAVMSVCNPDEYHCSILFDAW